MTYVGEEDRSMSIGKGHGSESVLHWIPITVAQIDAFHVAMPVARPYTTSFGTIATNHTVLLRITSEGMEAWSESTPLEAPEFSGEWAGSVMLALRDWLGPAVLGKQIDGPTGLATVMDRYRGNQFAKAAIDTAFWSLASQRSGLSLGGAIGGNRDLVEVGAAFGISPSIEALLDDVTVAIASGIRRVKLKVTTGWDIRVVEAVRSAYPDIQLHVDCNGHYAISDIDLFRALDVFDLAMIEQPFAFDDLLDHARLQSEIVTPVCLDESITSVSKARKAIELGACRVVNIKPGRVGGLSQAIAIDELCAEAGTSCWVGGMLESQLGAAICTALATRANMTYPADVFPTERFYERDLCEPAVRFEKGTDGGLFARSEQVAGVAQRPNPERLQGWTVDRFTLRG
jgi:O-succinylbenzoate synthase